ncbi:anthranilate synthase component I family protein [Paramicrobacterium fandaimingii]|uniref:anthranilate synthase component I family protein n=1 Tax=Paramicrobacterium fandaimingii TaxID=2708079 RepID=UPI001423B10B|nr:anthranilate synthase component I family protein [Microbacterium fandaimingii]
MAGVRQLAAAEHERADVLYDTLVGDDRFGFWLTTASPIGRVSLLGIGSPDGDMGEPWPGRSSLCDDAEHRFSGGWIGWYGYEREASAWLRVSRYVSVDHATGAVWAHAPEDEIAAWVLEVQRALHTPSPAAHWPTATVRREARARHTPDEYATMIASALESIRSGDAYQLCLTTRFTVDGPVDPRAVHAEMREADAPYTALIRVGERALVASSPEQFLQLTASGALSTSPIKGTRPRGRDAKTDAELATELEHDAKERAENLMIVDLMRNDLSRVCERGSVEVARLFDVESHAHVHQLVSQVTGRLASGRTAEDVVASAFPAGSMTGAPKERAMQLLSALEGSPRGAYSGCFGWIGDDGAMELAMTIRGVVIDADEAYVGAGGGLTIDSRADFEISEVAVKARAPLAALGAEVPAAWNRETSR